MSRPKPGDGVSSVWVSEKVYEQGTMVFDGPGLLQVARCRICGNSQLYLSFSEMRVEVRHHLEEFHSGNTYGFAYEFDSSNNNKEKAA